MRCWRRCAVCAAETLRLFLILGEIEGEVGRKMENGEQGDRRRVCVFQLIHFLPDVGSHLSWLETEYKARMLMTVTLHLLPSSSSLSTSLSSSPPILPLIPSLHILYVLSAQLISCLLSPPPLFYTLHLSSFPTQMHFVNPHFPSTLSLPSHRPSLHLT